MREILRAAGLESMPAREVGIHGETVIVVPVGADGVRLQQTARTALTGHYPVLVHDTSIVDDPDFHLMSAPADILARAAGVDPDARIAERIARWNAHYLGTGDEGFDMESYDMLLYGEPVALVIVPRPEPWAAFAYLDAYYCQDEPELLVAAARRWHERYGAEPTLVGMITNFTVARPPADPADAEHLAGQHLELAGLTGGTSERAYARALTGLHHWCLFDTP